jgi:chemotaxis protein methyltransferase CheR
VNEGVTVWSAGCAEGEEPYSVAILLLKLFSLSFSHHPPKVIGTDVNPRNIESAMKGVYDESKVALVDDSVKKRYFRMYDGQYGLKPAVRKLVEFRVENTFNGPGVKGADVILARNLLIYFDRERQEMLLNKLIGCLNNDGFLVLGKSETLPARMRDTIRPVALKERVYRKYE